MPHECAEGYGEVMSKPPRRGHLEHAKPLARIATHREGLGRSLGTLASGALQVDGEDMRVATSAAPTQIITDRRRDASNLDPVGAVGDVLTDLLLPPAWRSAQRFTMCRWSSAGPRVTRYASQSHH